MENIQQSPGEQLLKAIERNNVAKVKELLANDDDFREDCIGAALKSAVKSRTPNLRIIRALLNYRRSKEAIERELQPFTGVPIDPMAAGVMAAARFAIQERMDHDYVGDTLKVAVGLDNPRQNVITMLLQDSRLTSANVGEALQLAIDNHQHPEIIEILLQNKKLTSRNIMQALSSKNFTPDIIGTTLEYLITRDTVNQRAISCVSARIRSVEEAVDVIKSMTQISATKVEISRKLKDIQALAKRRQLYGRVIDTIKLKFADQLTPVFEEVGTVKAKVGVGVAKKARPKVALGRKVMMQQRLAAAEVRANLTKAVEELEQTLHITIGAAHAKDQIDRPLLQIVGTTRNVGVGDMEVLRQMLNVQTR